ncbi:MAG: DUF3306 domain-containing protein [Rhodoferax sp.]|uniref:DUF3306 domain-containing protein n=1 Tax=Rhodoferax sp. TaxID=50421 RepID=UPI00262FDDE0|nr:DUF3306 domain-containing protein [Rhodoferax sp.]MDD5332506.1 DUF3306 domain-containing protein [Rhodoferax sp.]
MAEGFLGRWSQRKQAARAGQTLQEPQSQPVIQQPATGPAPEATVDPDLRQDVSPPQPPPPLTLADAQVLTPESDFAPFVARDVTPEVRNAAMKKLFADPHYNQMDRMDVYVDDYSQADPLPESMLRQMVSAKFLHLFGDEEEGADKGVASAGASGDAKRANLDFVAQSTPPAQAGTDDSTENLPPERHPT